MPRDNSPLIVGDFWLDKRRDGKAPEIWQIATYAPNSRSVVYRSTKRRTVADAEPVLRAHEAAQRSKKPQDSDQAELLPHLFNYIREHGPDVHRLDTIKSSFRAWIGWLMQDEDLGLDATVSEINKVSVARFRRWRMGPHSWEVEWGGKVFRHNSNGVTGEAVQRNIEDLRSALHHAEAAGRITAPKIPSVDKKQRSKARKHIYTIRQLGAMIAYSDHDLPVQRWLWLMIGTAVRPDAGLAFDPARQWQGNLVDLHPEGLPITDKRNAVVPAIEPLQALMRSWPAGDPVGSRKRFFRTMRAKLGIPATHVPKTIRHTVASYLRNSGSVPGEQISALLGHKDESDTLERTSDWYAHADPLKMRQTIRVLTTLWKAVEREADKWRADHLLSISGDNNKTIVDRRVEKA